MPFFAADPFPAPVRTIIQTEHFSFFGHLIQGLSDCDGGIPEIFERERSPA
jgi:hypothetical protein